MDRIQQELSAAVKSNFKLLGLNITDPEVVCNCSISPGGNKPSPPPVFSGTPQLIVGSGVSPTGTVLSLMDPGNASFILPAGTTAASIVAAQQTDAQKALEVAKAAAAAAAAKLATSATVTVKSVGSGDSPLTTTVTATSSPDNSQTSVTVLTPYSTTTTNAPALVESFSSSESFAPFNSKRRLHTLKLHDGGWGLCGQLSGSQFFLFLVTLALGWYILKVVRDRSR